MVVISPKTPPRLNGPVILGVSGSGNSEEAVAFAFDEAAVRQTRLDAVLSWDDLAMRGFARAEPEVISMEDDEEHVVSPSNSPVGARSIRMSRSTRSSSAASPPRRCSSTAPGCPTMRSHNCSSSAVAGAAG